MRYTKDPFLQYEAELETKMKHRLPAGVIDLYHYDKSLPLGIDSALLHEDPDYRVFEITYESPVDGKVTAYQTEPSNQGKYPAIVFGHWGYGDKTEFLSEAILYAQAGTISLLVDCPWVRPFPWKKNINNYSDPDADRKVFIQAVIDLQRGFDVLSAHPNVDASRLAYIGHSYGAQWGAILSAIDNRIKAAVLIGGSPGITHIFYNRKNPETTTLRNQLGKERLETYGRIVGILDAIHYIACTSRIPLLFQFAKYERLLDDASMLAYFRTASEPKKIVWYNTGHELNDCRAVLDRSDWLEKSVSIPSIKTVMLKILTL